MVMLGEGVKEKEAGNRDGYGGGVVDVDGADEIALFAFEFQRAVRAAVVHTERLAI